MMCISHNNRSKRAVVVVRVVADSVVQCTSLHVCVLWPVCALATRPPAHERLYLALMVVCCGAFSTAHVQD